MTNTQLITNQINTWLNANSTDYKNKYDLTATYNPVEQERVINTLNLFLGDADTITKQEIENNNIRGVVQAGIVKKNEVFDIDASTPVFQVAIRADAKKTGIVDDVRAFIDAYNGLVTKEILSSGTYYYAWGFNTFEAVNSVNKNDVRFLTLTLTGDVTITRETNNIRAGYFGDEFSISITPPGIAEQQGVDVTSFTPTYTSNIERNGAGAEEEVVERYVTRNLSLNMILTRGSVLGEHYIDVLLRDNLDDDTTIKISWKKDDITTNEYIWDNAILTSISPPIQLGQFIFITVTYAKTI